MLSKEKRSWRKMALACDVLKIINNKAFKDMQKGNEYSVYSGYGSIQNIKKKIRMVYSKNM